MENKKSELPPLSLPSSPDHTIPTDLKKPPSTWQTIIGVGNPNQLFRPLPTQRPPTLNELDKIVESHSTWQPTIGDGNPYQLLSLPSSPDHTIPTDLKKPPSTWQTIIGVGNPNQLSGPLPTQRPPIFNELDKIDLKNPPSTWQTIIGVGNPNQLFGPLPTQRPPTLNELDKIGEPHSTWQPTIGDGNPYQSLSLPSSLDHTILTDLKKPPSTWQTIIGVENPNQLSGPLPTQRPPTLNELDKIGEPHSTWQPTIGDGNPYRSLSLPSSPDHTIPTDLKKPPSTWQTIIGVGNPNQLFGPLPTRRPPTLNELDKIGEPHSTWQPTIGDGNPYQSLSIPSSPDHTIPTDLKKPPSTWQTIIGVGNPNRLSGPLPTQRPPTLNELDKICEPHSTWQPTIGDGNPYQSLSIPSSPDHTIPTDLKKPPSTWQAIIGVGNPNQLSGPLPTRCPPTLNELDKIGEPHFTWHPTIGDENPYQSLSVPSSPDHSIPTDLKKPPSTWQTIIGVGNPNQLSWPLPTQRPPTLNELDKIGEPHSTWQPTIGDGNPYQSSRRRPTQQLGSDPFEDFIAAAKNKLKNDERERSYRPSTTSAYGSDTYAAAREEEERSYRPSTWRPKSSFGEGSSLPPPSTYRRDASADYIKRRQTGVFGGGGDGSSQRTAVGDDAYAGHIAAARSDEKRKSYQPTTWRSKPAYGDEERSDMSSDEEGRNYRPYSWRPKPAYGYGYGDGDPYGYGEGSDDAFAVRNKRENEGVIKSNRPSTRQAYLAGVGSSQYENYLDSLNKFKNEAEIIKPYSKLDLSRPPAAAKVERIVDPDGESSSLCSGCKLPIFSTPSISVFYSGDHLFMHEQCATLPPQWLHELHPQHALLLHNQLHHEYSTPANCHNCRELCGTLFYQCPNTKCDFRLDLLCVVQIKIVHRSHRHTLTAIRQRESDCLTCSACDTKHDALVPLSESQRITLSYLCHLCSFWIHPDCASLPNAILHYEDHKHSLFLTYNLPNPHHSTCFLCSQLPKPSSGVYFCLKCPNYLVHIRCTRRSPSTFKPVFIRDAKVSDLARLPLPNESTSLISYLRQDISEGDVTRLHPHPLTLNKIDKESPGRICNACVQTVAPPFYSCSTCPDFYLHSCCANLSTTIKHPIHEHPLSFSPKAPKSDISAGFTCRGCHLRCNGFAYSCKDCDDFSLDVACAMINPAITHESHKSTHILFMTPDIKSGSDEICNCCRLNLKGICYECSICRNFKLHARCALLPKTIRHGFDEHPLQLTTTNDDDDDDEYLCEVCEEHIERVRWYYSCSECNQSFHVDCIPSVDRLSKIKLGSTVRIDCHGCPLALVRESEAVWGGRRCRICRELLKSCGDGLAYECSKCFYGTHQNCAEKIIP